MTTQTEVKAVTAPTYPCKNCPGEVFLQPPMWPATESQEEGPRIWTHADGTPGCGISAEPMFVKPGGLSSQQLRVLVGMARGHSNARIGSVMHISENSVKTHAKRMFQVLGATDRASAVAIGFRKGWLK